MTLPSPEHFLSLQHQHVDRTLTNVILRKGTRGLCQHWSPHDIDLATTMIQIPQSMRGYGMTPNAITQISDKVPMASRFLGIVGSLLPSEQTICPPHQNVQDPSTWTLSHLLELKQEYNNLQIKYNCVVQESYVVQDPSAPSSVTLLLTPLTSLYSVITRNRELPQQGESRPVLSPTHCSLSRQIMKAWESWSEVIAPSQNSRMIE